MTGRRLVVFRLGEREHALPVEEVGEVVRMVAVTPVPDAPPWLAGVISVRGQVIPVIDLRARFGASHRDVGLNTPIIIAQAGDQTGGLIVDSVDDVLWAPAASLAPPKGPVQSSQPVAAVVTTGERLILVLDPEVLLAESGSFVPVEP